MSEFSSQYGKALYSLMKDEGKCEKALEELTVLDNLLKENQEYVKLLDNAGVAISERLKLIDEAFSGFDELVVNFIKILTEKKAVKELGKCIKEYFKMYDEDNNIERIVAVSAVPLSEEQIAKIKEKTEKLLNKTVFVKNEISKDILGGVILKFKDKEIDGSLKGRLNEIESHLRKTVF